MEKGDSVTPCIGGKRGAEGKVEGGQHRRSMRGRRLAIRDNQEKRLDYSRVYVKGQSQVTTKPEKLGGGKALTGVGPDVEIVSQLT